MTKFISDPYNSINMNIIGVLGTLFGAGGLFIGVYSHYKQRQFEKRQQQFEEQLKRKEELRELANTLRDTANKLNESCQSLKHPSNNGKLWYDLYDFSKDVLAYEHTNSTLPDIKVAVVKYEGGGDRINIKDPHEAIEIYSNNEIPNIYLEIDNSPGDPEEYTFLSISEAFNGIGWFKFHKRSLEEECEDLLNQMAPDLLDRVESQLDTILLNCFENALEVGPSTQFDPDEHLNIEDFAIGIVDDIIMYDNIDDDIEALSELVDEVEEIRKMALQSSYS
jgi:hypothetical protein